MSDDMKESEKELDYAKYLVYLGLDGYDTQKEHDKACEEEIKNLDKTYSSLIFKKLPTQYTDALNPEVMHFLYKQAYSQGFEDAREKKFYETNLQMIDKYPTLEDALKARGF